MSSGLLAFFLWEKPNTTNGVSGKRFGSFAKDMNMTPLLPIFEFEAKKLSSTSANQEYVYGERGGMERFKREIHSPHLPHCGMFGYMFNNNANYWTGKINAWITSLANQSPIDGIDWRGNDELLRPMGTVGAITKLISINKRVMQTGIVILHYLIDLA